MQKLEFLYGETGVSLCENDLVLMCQEWESLE